jgi:5-methylcytosine-specific restriction endonuclease McrA
MINNEPHSRPYRISLSRTWLRLQALSVRSCRSKTKSIITVQPRFDLIEIGRREGQRWGYQRWKIPPIQGWRSTGHSRLLCGARQPWTYTSMHFQQFKALINEPAKSLLHQKMASTWNRTFLMLLLFNCKLIRSSWLRGTYQMRKLIVERRGIRLCWNASQFQVVPRRKTVRTI